ncbi:hypothetical protein B0H15DRAFT_546209 [Mycena belliarum]|uniref:N-acetyltransferase domain-containing protein n=1 Tax=Mycena belliarum TaxID=1033014 RepID=A0AAD6UDE8_9AGAR|nr:hypothetical protein B0H15DRAFT_546209 [Mycena belliae]
MPSTTEPYTITYRSASSIPRQVWDALESHAQNANTILPVALKSLARERNHESSGRDQCWIVVHSLNTIDFVLSVTNSDMGTYPIFVFTTHPVYHLTPDFLLPRLIRLAEALRDAVPVKRVYSFFAPDIVARMLTEIWSSLTGVQAYREPYYHAKLTFCTRNTLALERKMSVFPGLVLELRPAVQSDLEGVAALCYQFAADSEPFVLTQEGAIKEAAILIRDHQVWVHGIRRVGDVADDIASIVAFTRNTDAVATISKVFTNPIWRRRGCAERLVRRVCKHLLSTKHSVALYVAHNNPAATKVYAKVGFLGLVEGAAPVEGVDSWLELGLDRSKIELGHW